MWRLGCELGGNCDAVMNVVFFYVWCFVLLWCTLAMLRFAGVHFVVMRFAGILFAGMHFVEVHFTGIHFCCDLLGCTLLGYTLLGCTLLGCIFTWINVCFIYIHNCCIFMSCGINFFIITTVNQPLPFSWPNFILKQWSSTDSILSFGYLRGKKWQLN